MGFRRKFLRRKGSGGRKGIVRDGLMLHLDGKDFSNNPATKLWYDRIRSETIAYTNKITNGDFNNGITGWTGTNLSVVSGALRAPLDSGNYFGTSAAAYNIPVGNKVYIRFKHRARDAGRTVYFYLSNLYGQDSVYDTWITTGVEWVTTSRVGTIATAIANCLAFYHQDNIAGGWMEIDEMIIIDLTALFGAGNEPAVTECDTLFPFVAASGLTHRSSDYNPDNMMKYNPLTWSGFTITADSNVKDSSGMSLTNATSKGMQFIAVLSTLKANTKYGCLFNIPSNTFSYSFYGKIGGTYPSPSQILTAGESGNKKFVLTSSASPTTEFKCGSNNSGSGTIKFKDIRVFELPTGSQIESDFTNLSADQLNIKYPMQRAALPYNFGYLAPYAQITSDFVEKIAGSVVENPNKFARANDSGLRIPSLFVDETNQSYIDNVKTLNSVSALKTNTMNGQISQHLFSFNLIEIFERRYGTIPSADQTTAGKVAWLSANTSSVVLNWVGYGVSPIGNHAILKGWRQSDTTWQNANTVYENTESSPSTIVGNVGTYATLSQAADANGFIHFLAYTDASDGVTASTIYTDYVKLMLNFKAASGYNNIGGIVFDGVDDYFITPHLGITGNQPYTIMVKGQLLTNASGDDLMFAYSDTTSMSAKTFGLYARSGASKFRVSTYTVNDYDTGFNKDYNEHVWALVYDGVGTLVYQDGVVDSVGKKTVTNPSATANSIMILGKLTDSNYCNFKLEKAVMFNKVLTEQEIKQNTLAMK